VSQADQVNNLINHLTNDDDQRQDLWVYYLSGHSVDSFVSYLEELKAAQQVERKMQANLWQILKNSPSYKFAELLSKLSELECSVVCLLTLGLSVNSISEYKGISEVRIRQLISVVRYNEVWEELYAEEMHKMSATKEDK
jgi:hypothetical protein